MGQIKSNQSIKLVLSFVERFDNSFVGKVLINDLISKQYLCTGFIFGCQIEKDDF